jgi:hypothetical protein
MVSEPVIKLLHASYEELHRLELLLEQNSVYRRVEALRRLIEEYEADIAGSSRPDLRWDPGSAGTATAPGSPPMTVSPSHPANSHDLAETASQLPPDPVGPVSRPSSRPVGPSVTVRRRGGPRERSQAKQIRDAAAVFLQTKGKPATGTEIYRAIHEMGVEVRGKKPSTVVCNTLRWSPNSFTLSPEGFGLTAWSNSSAALPNGKE